MGAWAEDAFGDDTGCDWAGEFLETPSVQKLEESIDETTSGDDYIESFE